MAAASQPFASASAPRNKRKAGLRFSRFPMVAMLLIGTGVLCAAAAEIRVNNATDLKTRTSTLQPGDTLIAESGTYTLTTWNIQNISGTRTNWITIRAESNAVIRGTATSANVIEIQNVHYLNFAGFEIVTTAATNYSIDGIKFSASASSYLTFDRLYIHGMGGNGMSLFAPEASFITLRNSEIASVAGSGLYWGYPSNNIVHDVLIENNYIHHCPVNPLSDVGYGIQFKGWGYRARIVDNVLHDVGGTARSGLIVYYGRKPLQGDVPDDMNIVRGNVLWNCRSEGITAMSDALIENNIVFDAVVGINLQTYNDGSFSGPNYVENLVVRNNTAYRCSSACISVPSAGWTPVGSNVALTGNAAYRTNSSQAAFSGSGGAARIAGNVRYGTGLSTGVTVGNGLADFRSVVATGTVPNLDFYPSANSALTNKVMSPQDWPGADFNGSARPYAAAVDAGAYERAATNNPGSTIQAASKPPIAPTPPVIQQIVCADATNYFVCWPYTVKWTEVEFVRSLDASNWVSLAGPLYATNSTVALPASASNGFFRIRLE